MPSTSKFAKHNNSAAILTLDALSTVKNDQNKTGNLARAVYMDITWSWRHNFLELKCVTEPYSLLRDNDANVKRSIIIN